MILPATLQGELADERGDTTGITAGTAQYLSDLCRRAEATGADSLWAVDHLFWPHPINECLTTLAIAAAATRRPTLGACVLQLPLRQPAAVAKQATALQQLSGGRFVLGVGVGSHPAEYARAGVDFHRRGRLMDEGIDAMQRAWASGYEPDASYPQVPTSSRVPLWIGGSSPAARRRAAAVGDGWVPLFLTPDDYAPALLALRQETEAAGRDPDAVEPAVVVFARVGPDDEAPTHGATVAVRNVRPPAQGLRTPSGRRRIRDVCGGARPLCRGRGPPRCGDGRRPRGRPAFRPAAICLRRPRRCNPGRRERMNPAT